jgi:hypothetical protein
VRWAGYAGDPACGYVDDGKLGAGGVGPPAATTAARSRRRRRTRRTRYTATAVTLIPVAPSTAATSWTSFQNEFASEAIRSVGVWNTSSGMLTVCSGSSGGPLAPCSTEMCATRLNEPTAPGMTLNDQLADSVLSRTGCVDCELDWIVSDGSPVTLTATCQPIWIVFVMLLELVLGVPEGGRVVEVGLVLVDVGVGLEDGVDDGATVC